MDDWSLLPSRNAVSEPAPDPPSTMSSATLPLPGSTARVKRPPTGVDYPCPQHAALDPAALAWQPVNRSGAGPQNPTNHRRSALTATTHTSECQKTSEHPLTPAGPSWMTERGRRGLVDRSVC